MNKWNRRDVLKGGVASLGAGILLPNLVASEMNQPSSFASSYSTTTAGGPSNALRDRLLMGFGWRFALGHASDPANDFGYGQGKVLSRAGTFSPTALPGFDDSQWRTIDLPHDWTVELPFENVESLNDYGYKPLGRLYPETSIGWYRRSF